MDKCTLCLGFIYQTDGTVCMKCGARASKVVKGNFTGEMYVSPNEEFFDMKLLLNALALIALGFLIALAVLEFVGNLILQPKEKK